MAAGSTYTPLAINTLSGAAASVTFSSISGSYTDLIIIANAGISNAGTTMVLRFNGDTGSNYSQTTLAGNGSAASSSRGSSATALGLNDTAAFNSSLEGNLIFNVMNYANTTTYKTLIGRFNRASASNYPGAAAFVGLYRSTSAITSLVMFPQDGSNIISGSTFTLYGIAAA